MSLPSNPFFDTWPDTLIRGVFNCTLMSANFTYGDEEVATGNGFVSWKSGERIKFKGITSCEPSFLRSTMSGYGLLPGSLIPRDQFLILNGTTADGWEVRGDPTPRDGMRIEHDVSSVVWDYETNRITMFKKDETTTARTIRAVFTSPPRIWSRSTSTTVANPYFNNSTSSQLDWMEAKLGWGLLAARLRDEDRFEIYLSIDATPPTDDAMRILQAIGVTFGVMAGKRSSLLGYEDSNAFYIKRDLAHINPKRGASVLESPFDRVEVAFDCAEAWLSKGVNFFLTDLGNHVAHCLDFCWGVKGSDLDARQVILSTAAESLVDRACIRDATGDSAASIEAGKARALLEAAESITPAFKSRLYGVLGNFSKPRVQDVLYGWIAQGHLGITRDDVNAWASTRNPAAHGGLIGRDIGFDRRQIQIDGYNRVAGVLNKLVLHLAGYSGCFMDVSRRGWPIAILEADGRVSDPPPPPSAPSPPPGPTSPTLS